MKHVTHLYSFLVHPGADGTEPPMRSADIDVSDGGKLLELMNDLLARAPDECDLDIEFVSDKKQNNPCRSELVAFAHSPSLSTGEPLAARLRSVTTRRSRLGLFFIVVSGARQARTVLLSRFPADSGILADDSQSGALEVKFLERVFMKNAHAYKAALYSGDASAHHDFWRGAAVDRQINQVDASEYWIKDFLCSDFRATSTMGTKQFARALRDVLRTSSDPEIRTDVSALSRLVSGLDRKKVSIAQALVQFSVSDAARDAVVAALPSPAAANEKFVFAAKVFKEQVGYRLLTLKNGALLGATNEDFDSVFKQERDGKRIKFTTSSSIAAERLRKGAP